jgi:hypothetical protein
VFRWTNPADGPPWHQTAHAFAVCHPRHASLAHPGICDPVNWFTAVGRHARAAARAASAESVPGELQWK